jgi:hypothetical protein
MPFCVLSPYTVTCMHYPPCFPSTIFPSPSLVLSYHLSLYRFPLTGSSPFLEFQFNKMTKPLTLLSTIFLLLAPSFIICSRTLCTKARNSYQSPVNDRLIFWFDQQISLLTGHEWPVNFLKFFIPINFLCFVWRKVKFSQSFKLRPQPVRSQLK